MNGLAPPPPPPPPVAFAIAPHGQQNNGPNPSIDKSRLLADICKGTTLRKTVVQERSPTAGLNGGNVS